MMWNQIPNSEKLHKWKMLRDKIAEYPLDEQLIELAKFCKDMPFGKEAIDPYTSVNWPSPWDILYKGDFCISTISLLMFHTLSAIGCHAAIELQLIQVDTSIFLVPVISSEYVLNYFPGTVVKVADISHEYTVLRTYSRNDII